MPVNPDKPVNARFERARRIISEIACKQRALPRFLVHPIEQRADLLGGARNLYLFGRAEQAGRHRPVSARIIKQHKRAGGV